MIQKVRTNLIQDGAIFGNVIGSNAVSTNNIVVGAVTSNIIANGAVTNAKLSEPNAFEDYFLLGLGS